MYKGDALFQCLRLYDFNLYRKDQTVPQYLKEHFKQYIDDIEKAANGNNPLLGEDFCTQLLNQLSEIKRICDEIVKIAERHRDGQVKNAYEMAYPLFSSMRSYYLTRREGTEPNNYYRLRQGDLTIQEHEDSKSKSKKAAMFHIKESDRHLIGAYRFSIQGFPCLYLAGSFELGWFESGMPNKVSYCKMCIEETGEDGLKLIDISNRPVDLLSSVHVWLLNAKNNEIKKNYIFQYLMNYIITYPLAAACSIKVRNRGEKFVEEYVLPQLFMQWIRDDDQYAGIRYKSSLNSTLVQGMGAVNIALPVKKFRNDGLCETLTSKISVSDIGFLDVNQVFQKYLHLLKQIEDFKNELWNRRINRTHFKYAQNLISICEDISLIYNSIMNGTQLNELILHQIDSLADYISTIKENKNNIVKINIEQVKGSSREIDETELQKMIEADIDKFWTLAMNVVHKNIVFNFSKGDVDNFEKI